MVRRTVLIMLLVPALVAAVAPPNATDNGVPDPTVEGPVTHGIHGRPWFSSLVDLAPHQFVEEEFFISGTAGDAGDYRTRLVVRRPQNPDDFSGTVYVEWVNVTGGRDLETLWPAGHKAILEEGHAYVVVSAQLVGHTELRAWDPVRYGTLTHPGDTPGSFHIFEQAVEAVRDPAGIDPMGGLDVEYVVATGDSQSAGRLTTYITDGSYAIAGHIDGFLPGRGGGNSATGEVADALGIPMLWMLEEDQGERPADTEFQKFWFQAGASHAPLDWAHYVWRSDMRDLAGGSPIPDAINAGCSINRGEGHMVRSGIHWINQWVRGLDAPGNSGGAGSRDFVPPTAPRMERDDADDLVRDEDGHALGGIRYPYIEAPIGVNTAEDCPLFGTYEPFASSEIVERYPTSADYVGAVEVAADRAVAEGFLLPSDREDVLYAARRFDVWSPGAALCHDLEGPMERLYYNGTHRPCPPAIG